MPLCFWVVLLCFAVPIIYHEREHTRPSQVIGGAAGGQRKGSASGPCVHGLLKAEWEALILKEELMLVEVNSKIT